jgi:hypothetical protein
MRFALCNYTSQGFVVLGRKMISNVFLNIFPLNKNTKQDETSISTSETLFLTGLIGENKS